MSFIACILIGALKPHRIFPTEHYYYYYYYYLKVFSGFWAPTNAKLKTDAMNQGQKQVIAAHDVQPHSRITVTELESHGETTFL